jgi:Cellulase (glycosyl hydrolase family 5)
MRRGTAWRRPAVVGLAIVAVVAAGVPLLLSTGPSADGAASRSAPDGSLFGFGDSSALYRYPGAPTPERLAELEARAGAEVARFPIRWESVQPLPPLLGGHRYRWDRYDGFVEALRDRGIRPLPVLLGAPGWAHDPPLVCRGTLCPPARWRLDEWGDFAAAVARRYPDAAGIEVWNEPNHAGAWQTAAGPEPARYARLFERAARAIHAVDPGLPVVIGSVGFTHPTAGAPGDVTIPRFLEGFYDAVDRKVLDPAVGLGVHTYPSPEETDELLPDGQFATVMSQVRDVRDSRDPGRLLWVTEFGASTTAVGDQGPVTEEDQASAVLDGLAELESAADVRAALIYTVVDRPPHESPAEEGYGLVERGPGFAPKLAYCEVAAERGEPRPAGC